jgi:hypothetical protein
VPVNLRHSSIINSWLLQQQQLQQLYLHHGAAQDCAAVLANHAYDESAAHYALVKQS